jgi:hypothetical protein
VRPSSKRVPVVSLAEEVNLTPQPDSVGTQAKSPWWQKFRVRAAAKKAAKLTLTAEVRALPQTGVWAPAAQAETSAGGASSSQLLGTTAKAPGAPLPVPPPPPAHLMPWMRGKIGQKGKGGKGKPKGKGKVKGNKLPSLHFGHPLIWEAKGKQK